MIKMLGISPKKKKKKEGSKKQNPKKNPKKAKIVKKKHLLQSEAFHLLEA